MILNNADNMMFSSSEVDRVYCGSVKVWERGGSIPAEVQVQIDYLTEQYFSGYSSDDLYYMYGLYGSTSDKPLLYAVAMISDPNLTGINIGLGHNNDNYVDFSKQAADNQLKFAFSSPATYGSDTSFPSGYSFKYNVTSLSQTFRTWTPSGGWGGMNPIALYGNYPDEKISYIGDEFEVTYNQ